jgi:uncharacterized protein
MMSKLLRRVMPNSQRIREHHLLAWLGPSLQHPQLWHVSREGIALGAAIGGFFGLLVPFGQIPVAAAAAIVLRANLPMAVTATFITNPFTLAPLYYIAYRLGVMLLPGAEQLPLVATVSFDVVQEVPGWFELWTERTLRLGKPLFIGLFVMACSFSVFSYFFISWLWRVLTMRAWHRRAALRRASGNLSAVE